MSTGTTIEWTSATWNPTTGCDRVSPGCDHCYAATIAGRLWPTQYPPNPDGSPRRFEDVRLHPDRLDLPLRWRKPRLVFVDSMSDLFHADVPGDFIVQVFAVMAVARRHTFQVLTKRPGPMASVLRREDFEQRVAEAATEMLASHPIGFWPRGTFDEWRCETVAVRNIWHPPVWPLPNVWLGTSVENQKWADVRIPKLLETPAAVRFLSCEPLLGPVDLSRWLGRGPCPGCGYAKIGRAHVVTNWGMPDHPVPTIDWVITGGESGPGARPMHPDWARAVRDDCQTASVPYFFKQWGGRTPKAGGRELDGRTWDEMPETLPARDRRLAAGSR